jgi:hypothetical protein
MNPTYRLPASAATVNAAVAFNGPTKVVSVTAFNAAQTGIFCKLYQLDANLAAPDQTKIPTLTLYLAPGNNAFDFVRGVEFPIGCGIRLCTGAADADNTAIAANDVLGLNLVGSRD